LYSTTCEGFIPGTGRGFQGATSHCLGQNFARMFHIEFLDEDNKTKMCWQNSWGITTRTIGAMVMFHGDNKGLVLPPRVAPVQCVFVPIFFKDTKGLIDQCEVLSKELQAAGVRTHGDYRDNYNPGWKYNHWELKGVPLRLELGPKDVEAKQVRVVRRDTGDAENVPWTNLVQRVVDLLVTIQHSMLEKARERVSKLLVQCTDWQQFTKALESKCMAMTTWCGRSSCEEQIKTRSLEESKAHTQEEQHDDDQQESGEKLTGAAKSLCTPFNQPDLPAGAKCFMCGQPAINWTVFARSY